MAGTCTAGAHPFGGVNARAFCGPAKVTLAHHAGKGYAIITAMVTLGHSRTRGTFTGKVFGSNTGVHGTFRGC